MSAGAVAPRINELIESDDGISVEWPKMVVRAETEARERLPPPVPGDRRNRDEGRQARYLLLVHGILVAMFVLGTLMIIVGALMEDDSLDQTGSRHPWT